MPQSDTARLGIRQWGQVFEYKTLSEEVVPSGCSAMPRQAMSDPFVCAQSPNASLSRCSPLRALKRFDLLPSSRVCSVLSPALSCKVTTQQHRDYSHGYRCFTTVGGEVVRLWLPSTCVLDRCCDWTVTDFMLMCAADQRRLMMLLIKKRSSAR